MFWRVAASLLVVQVRANFIQATQRLLAFRAGFDFGF
jgi:hypothetical protein